MHCYDVSDAFELWCWRRLFRVPWTTRRPNQSILKEINLEYSFEGLMLKLKLQYFGHLKNWLLRKDPDAGKEWRQERGTTEDEMVGWHHQLDRHEFEQAPGVGDGQGSLLRCSPCGHRVGPDWVTELNWLMCLIRTINLSCSQLSFQVFSSERLWEWNKQSDKGRRREDGTALKTPLLWARPRKAPMCGCSLPPWLCLSHFTVILYWQGWVFTTLKNPFGLTLYCFHPFVPKA